MKTLKYSRQREAIKNFLSCRSDHPTADIVYRNIKEDFPNISLGTVYRNLSLLADRGEILKLSCGDIADRFDARITPHYHFSCCECGMITDLELSDMEQINQLAASQFNGKIYGHSLYFYGVCETCAKKVQKTS